MRINPLHEEWSKLTSSQARFLRYVAIILAGLFFVLPISYLVLRHKGVRAVAAQSIAPQPAAPSITQLEEVVRTQPTEENRIHLSWAYLSNHQPGRAIPVLLAIVAQNRNNADAWNNLCVAHNLQMEYSLAQEACKQAIHIQPEYQLAKNNLKWAEDEIRTAQQAIAAAEQLAPASRNADSYQAEGLNFLHIGNYQQATKAWQRVLELDPKNAVAANNIGIAQMAEKQPGKAIPWFEKAIELDPTMQLAKNNLAWARDEVGRSFR
jgi:tetratricopeptide (TPR) repeat protein